MYSKVGIIDTDLFHMKRESFIVIKTRTMQLEKEDINEHIRSIVLRDIIEKYEFIILKNFR